MSGNCDDSRSINTTTTTTTTRCNNISLTSIISTLSLVSGGVLLVCCAVEFHKINTYVKAQCFILSTDISSNYGPVSSHVLYRAVWNIILYDSDGINTTTSIWSSISESPPASDVYSLAAQYQNNHTYTCYHPSSSLDPTQIQFEPPSKLVAIGYLIACIILILFGIAVFLLKKCIGWRCPRQKPQQQNNTETPMDSTGTVTALPSQQNPYERQDSLSPPATPPPPSYNEAVEQMGPSTLRGNLDHILSKWQFNRQTSNATRF